MKSNVYVGLRLRRKEAIELCAPNLPLPPSNRGGRGRDGGV